jgi:hypothetical protein
VGEKVRKNEVTESSLRLVLFLLTQTRNSGYSLAQHNSVTNGMFSSAIEEFTKRLGWIIGLHTGPEPLWRSAKDSSLATFTAGSLAIGYVGARPWE